MNFLQKLFGSDRQPASEKEQENKKHDFDVLKYDGVRALKSGQFDYAARCFQHALQRNDDLEVHDYLSQALIQLGDLRAAYDELQLLSDAQPDTSRFSCAWLMWLT